MSNSSRIRWERSLDESFPGSFAYTVVDWTLLGTVVVNAVLIPWGWFSTAAYLVASCVLYGAAMYKIREKFRDRAMPVEDELPPDLAFNNPTFVAVNLFSYLNRIYGSDPKFEYPVASYIERGAEEESGDEMRIVYSKYARFGVQVWSAIACTRVRNFKITHVCVDDIPPDEKYDVLCLAMQAGRGAFYDPGASVQLDMLAINKGLHKAVAARNKRRLEWAAWREHFGPLTYMHSW